MHTLVDIATITLHNAIIQTTSEVLKMQLYHGSKEKIEKLVFDGSHTNGFSFDGIFANQDKESALSHGSELHTFEIEDNKVLTQSDIECIEKENVINILINANGRLAKLTTEQIERICDLVINDDQFIDTEEAEELFDTDAAEASWECQRLRGHVARNLGYRAVEMNDEHGKSFLIVS